MAQQILIGLTIESRRFFLFFALTEKESMWLGGVDPVTPVEIFQGFGRQVPASLALGL
jgi:hypothetical protein